MSGPMSEPIRIWLEVAHHAAFRVGGWAFVREDAVQAAGKVSGKAGGDRRLDAERAALAALIAALEDTAGARPVQLQTASALVATVPARIAAARTGEAAPTDNLDLWAQAMTALAAAPVTILRLAPTPGAPGAFATAWAELARDKAKDKGPFVSAIPKPNLAKAGVAQ